MPPKKNHGKGHKGGVKKKSVGPSSSIKKAINQTGGPKNTNKKNDKGNSKQTKKDDGLSKLAKENWKALDVKNIKFNAKIVDEIFNTHLRPSDHSYKICSRLENSHYLENYLWPFFDSETASFEHIFSLCLLINEKFREGVDPWESVSGVTTADGELIEENAAQSAKFEGFFDKVLEFVTPNGSQVNDLLTAVEKKMLTIFFINCFRSLENPVVRGQVLPLVSFGIWENLRPSLLEKKLSESKRLQSAWVKLGKRNKKMKNKEKIAKRQRAMKFLPNFLAMFLATIKQYKENLDKSNKSTLVQFAERCVEFLIDVQSQLPTRRYTHAILEQEHILIECKHSLLSQSVGPFAIFNKLLDMLRFYMGFEINNTTGTALTDNDMADQHYKDIKELQRTSFQHFQPDLTDMALTNVRNIDTRIKLEKHLSVLVDERLFELASLLCLVPTKEESNRVYSRRFLLDVLVEKFEVRLSQIDAINDTPLYPSEEILFDENIPSDYSNDSCLALPKLNLQFLTLHDYLLRNLNLFMLESAYEIRQDIMDVTKRMPATLDGAGNTHFQGWARMALQINKFLISDIAKPNLGESKPSRIRADIRFSTEGCRPKIKEEWESLRKHDIMFLVTIQAKSRQTEKYDPSKPFVEQIGIKNIRGCEVEGLIDSEGKVIEENPEKAARMPKGNDFDLRVWLDTSQYAKDIKSGQSDIYENFNLLVRRKPKENNFKAILATIRDLMNTSCVVPDWLNDVFLGYGDPASAHYSNVISFENSRTYNFNDTFLDAQHLKDSFPENEIKFTVDDESLCKPPFKLTFPPKDENNSTTISVEPFKHINMGPYPQDKPNINSIKFTPVQVDAINTAMNPGLTMVVGPPGTGKTDVAVQMISNWYHNNPNQRTLLITHSNQALNQIFEKIMKLDIDERHLLRLGMAEKELNTDKVFTKYGRVNYILERRLKLLGEVQRLADGLGVAGDIGYTCETAGHFYLYNVLSKWEEYKSKVKVGKCEVADISTSFPFTPFFASAPQPLFKGKTYEEDMDIAEGCYRHIQKIFTELDEFKAFEILRNGPDRVDYLLVKEAKIIAMTCTHAALKRSDLVNLKFQYDNVLMEEAAQVLEIETFIPLMCQNPEDGRSRLKRVVLIGDHHQLPPVIKNMAFQKFCNMEQSLFTRFIRLNVPAIQLNKQGRARPSLAKLYNWRYRGLGDLEHVVDSKKFQLANPGFMYEYQFINVPDLNGQGESQPQPYFYQNLGEAEYIVWMYMYMRLIGYPAEKITIITTYNGQKHLIRDILNTRCAWNPVYGLPAKVSTVDRYQGQQNDYILLSLVRTANVGHVRDVRRLVVALSRARLGLYVFGREQLFSNCFELRPSMNLLRKRPTTLSLINGERYGAERKLSDKVPEGPNVMPISDVQQLSQYVQYLEKPQAPLPPKPPGPPIPPPPPKK